MLYVSRDPVYKDNETAAFGYVPGKTNVVEAAKKNTNGKYFNYYRERTVGVLAGKYDDYSFKEKDTSTGKIKPNPQYLKSNNARSFLNFGITPTDHTPAGIRGGGTASRSMAIKPHTSFIWRTGRTEQCSSYPNHAPMLFNPWLGLST